MWKGRAYGMDRYCTLKGHQHFNVRSVPSNVELTVINMMQNQKIQKCEH